jgi:hypothetical protein
LAIFMFSIIVWVNLHSIIGHGTVAEGPGVHRSLHAHRSPIFLPLYSKENILHIDLELRPFPHILQQTSVNPETNNKLSRLNNRV